MERDVVLRVVALFVLAAGFVLTAFGYLTAGEWLTVILLALLVLKD